MSNVKKGDIFVVSRNGTQFQVKNQDTSNLRDDDLFWVQRNGVNYSVTADQVNTGEAASNPALSLVTLSKTTTGDRYTDQQFLTAPSYTTPGNPPPVVGLKAEVTGALSIVGATDEIVGISGNTLTLASDVNLANGVFQAGDVVKQNNSPIVPVSSAITNVTPPTGAMYSSGLTVSGSGWDAGAPPSAGFSATVEAATSSSNNAEITWTIDPSWGLTGTVTMNPGPYAYQYSINGASFSADMPKNTYTNLGDITGINTFAIRRWVDSETDSLTRWSAGAENTGAAIIRLNGLPLFDVPQNTVLTLQDASGLSDFNVGDVVQAGVSVTAINESAPSVTTDGGAWIASDGTATAGTWNQDEVWSNYFTSAPSIAGTQTRAFDSTLGMQGGYWTNECKWEPTTPITYYDKVEVYDGIGQRYHSNDEVVSSDVPSNTWTLLRANPNGASGDVLSSIEIERPGDTNEIHTMSGLRIDGRLYVDAGIAGNPGETFVTAPSKPITATFVSADPLVPSMTLSDVVGPWSANTGNYVENTVVNPIMIKPETSPITSSDVISVSNKAAVWSANCTQDPSWERSSDFTGMFNGDSTVNGFWRGNTYFTISPGIQVNSSLQLRLSCRNVANGAATTQLKLNGSHFNPPITADGVTRLINFDITSPIVITRVELDPPLSSDGGGEACSVYEWIVDGKVLVDANLSIDVTQTTLAFEDDTDLAQFATGDAVYANETFTPTTSPITAVNGTTLSFADSTGLDNFRVGDQIQATVDQREVWSNTIYHDNFQGRTWEPGYEPINAFSPYPTAGRCITNGTLLITQPVTAVIGIGGVEFITASSSTQDFKIYYNGQVVEAATTSGSWVSTTYAGPIDKVSVKCNGNNTQFTQIKINGRQLVNKGVAASSAYTTVTSINTNNAFLEASGGTWEVGDVVSLLEPLSPATGTVGSTDPAGPTMTISGSGGRWCTTTKVTMDEKPTLSSTAPLSFDANGAVSGIATGTPGYVNMNSGAPILTFPSTFSDGKTPDETIPEGSYIQTEVRAWNATGESTMKSNKVTPVATTRLSKGETKLIDGYTPVASAAARQTLAEAHKIENNITKASDNLKLLIAKI